MIEDKLTAAERIRLEAINQANAAMIPNGLSSRGDGRALFALAKKIEEFVKEGTVPNAV